LNDENNENRYNVDLNKSRRWNRKQRMEFNKRRNKSNNSSNNDNSNDNNSNNNNSNNNNDNNRDNSDSKNDESKNDNGSNVDVDMYNQYGVNGNELDENELRVLCRIFIYLFIFHKLHLCGYFF